MTDLSGVKLEYVDSVAKAEALMRWLGERHPTETLGVDIETGEFPGNPKADALSPWHGRIRLAQIGDGNTGWAVPWERWGGVFEEAFTKFEGYFLIHNSAFDTRWLTMHSDLNIPWHRLHDSMIASRIISPTESAALKRLTAKYVDPRAAALQTMLDDKMRDNGWTWGTVPINLQEYWSYGALDTVLAVRMWEKLGVDVLPGGPYAGVYDLEMAVRRICTVMENNGARIDIDYSEQQLKSLRDTGESISEWARNAYDGVNIGSTKQLVTLFQGRLGATITERTDAGNPKVDKIQLQRFQRDYKGTEVEQLANAILAYRKADKLAGSYFKNFLDRHQDGVLHPSINTLAARTSRMSIQDPALQTLPKKDKLVRKAFIPRNENEIIMSCDLEQVEARVFANLSGDEGLINLFNYCDATGEDFFTQIGREVYSEPGMMKSDPRRQLLKNMMYGRLYGAGNDKMALTAGVQAEQMKAVNNSFDGRFPGMKNLMRTIEDLGMRRLREEGQAYVLTGSGRRLPADEGKVYTLVNYCVTPDTLILRSDLRHVSASNISVGDRLVGFDENQTGTGSMNRWGSEHKIRRMRTAIVEKVSRVMKETVRVTIADGRHVECSTDHLWLVRSKTASNKRSNVYWKQASQLTGNDLLISSGVPWQEDTTREAGWLAGLYDGEGSLSTRGGGQKTTVLTFSQNTGSVMEKFKAEMSKRGFKTTYSKVTPGSTSTCDNIRAHGVFNIMKILGTLQPEKYKSRFESVYEGTALTGGVAEYVEVVSVEPVGKKELVSIQTTTRTLIANGLLSHNCIQGTSAEILKLNILKLDAAGLGELLIVPVHDEVVLSVPSEDKEEVGRVVQECMTTREGWTVPLLAGAPETGERWGNLGE